jgi:hypothetical protein
MSFKAEDFLKEPIDWGGGQCVITAFLAQQPTRNARTRGQWKEQGVHRGQMVQL